jgi:hypothetical protein
MTVPFRQGVFEVEATAFNLFHRRFKNSKVDPAFILPESDMIELVRDFFEVAVQAYRRLANRSRAAALETQVGGRSHLRCVALHPSSDTKPPRSGSSC